MTEEIVNRHMQTIQANMAESLRQRQLEKIAKHAMSEKEIEQPVAGRNSNDRQAEEEQTTERVEGHDGQRAQVTNAISADTTKEIEQLLTENQRLNATVLEREATISRFDQDNKQLREDVTAVGEKVQDLKRYIVELKEAVVKAEGEAEHLRMAAQSRPEWVGEDSASQEAIQQREARIAELEARVVELATLAQAAEKRAEVAVNRVEAMDGSLLDKKKSLAELHAKYEDKKNLLQKSNLAVRILQSHEKALQDELALRTQQLKDASDAVRHLEQQLREAQEYLVDTEASGVFFPAPAPDPEGMDVDGPPELPSPPSSPVAMPTEVCEAHVRNRRLSQHNDTLRAGHVKLEQDVQTLREKVERLQRENAVYEPFVLSSEQRDGELELLTEENAALCRSNERIREEVEELRSLRDRGLLKDLKEASPDGLVPSEELAGLLAQNMANVFAGIEAVLAETPQRKFTITDRPQPAATSLSRRQSMVFKQATRPSTPAFAHTGSIATRSFTAPGQSASSAAGWNSAKESGWPSG